ncbi:MAG: hypothetical protein ABEJ88_09540 [Halobacterium sp.]
MTPTELLAARRLELAAVAVAGVAALAAGSPGAAPIAMVVGFFAAKSVESLRRATR